MLVNPLDPLNADKLQVKIADLGNACWVVSKNTNQSKLLLSATFTPEANVAQIHFYFSLMQPALFLLL